MSNITCIVHTYNSEKYLDACLTHLAWADEILIVDMYSNDLTLEIAKKHNCRILMHENVGYVEPARQFGVNNAKYDWILSVDSDEIIPITLAEKLRVISKNNQADVVKISFRNFFFGKELKGSGWAYKDQVIPRFFNRKFLSYGAIIHSSSKIHENARILRIVEMNSSIVHFNYDTVEQFITKLNRYTNIESNNDKFQGRVIRQFFYHFFREFFGRYFYKQGYKDGWLGLYLAFAMAFYRLTSIAKANLDKEVENIVNTYNELAKKIK